MKDKHIIEDVINCGGYKNSEYYPYIETIIICGFDFAFEDLSRFKNREISKYDNQDYESLMHLWEKSYSGNKLKNLTLLGIYKKLPLATQKFLEYSKKNEDELFIDLYKIIFLAYETWIDHYFSNIFDK